LCFDVLLLVSEVLVTFYGNIPREASGWRTILLGHYWWVFWIVQVGMGIILPVFIVASSRLNRSVKWLGAAGFLMILGILALRINIIIPPQLEPAFPTLPEAYHHFRFAYGYVPSVNEWFVGLGIFAVGIWGCLIANRLLPLEEEQLPRTL
jgi:molybdopterin-containing oxidoreductase family membrane subunit